MKSYIAIAALFAAAASAQSISDLPACSLQCILTAVSGTGCSATDFKCSCSKADQLTSSVEPCVEKACSAADQATVITVLEGICSGAGVPITISAPGSGATSSAAAVTSSAAVATSSAAAATSSAAETSSAAAPTTSSVCTTSTVYTTVSAVPTGTGSHNGTISTPTPPAYTGAATGNAVTFGAAGVAGLLAFFL